MKKSIYLSMCEYKVKKLVFFNTSEQPNFRIFSQKIIELLYFFIFFVN